MARSNLVPNIQPESPQKLAPTRSIATCARSMGVHTLCTIPRIVVSMRKTKRRKPISVLPRKADQNPIPKGRPFSPVEQEVG